MAARKIQVGHLDVRVTAEPLTQEAFAPFGDVVCNPRPDVLPGAYATAAAANVLPPNAVSANQGFAIQYRNVSRVANLYHDAPSAAQSGDAASSSSSSEAAAAAAKPIMSMFVCSSRPLNTGPSRRRHAEFVVRHLERHPFTTQTFTPVASSASLYLVIVAPSLPPSEADADFPVAGPGRATPGRGLPDLGGLRAFVATRGQAVTYGAGTWHAPMVVLGAPGTTLDFVVMQFSSGVPLEDCQLLEFEAKGRLEPRLVVQVPIPNVPRTGNL